MVYLGFPRKIYFNFLVDVNIYLELIVPDFTLYIYYTPWQYFRPYELFIELYDILKRDYYQC